MPRITKLDNIYSAMKADPAFKHLSESSANFVPGDGPWPNPAAMMIGEAPGEHEDKLLRPFVGKSGNLLDNAMWDAGLKRSEVFITNVIKWRPPGNRTPTQEEVELAVPYLRKEVTAVLPNGGLIILLGSVALSVADPDLRIGQVHAEPFTHAKWTFMPMFHPAYVLRAGKREAWREGWLKIKELRAA